MSGSCPPSSAVPPAFRPDVIERLKSSSSESTVSPEGGKSEKIPSNEGQPHPSNASVPSAIGPADHRERVDLVRTE